MLSQFDVAVSSADDPQRLVHPPTTQARTRCALDCLRSRAPHLTKREGPIHDLPDAQFVEALRELDGTPEAILNNSELIQWLLPLLRADFRIADQHVAPRTPLNCPLTVLAGTEDETVSPAEAEAWKELTTDEFDIHWITGGHFFVERNREWVLEKVTALVTDSIRRRELLNYPSV